MKKLNLRISLIFLIWGCIFILNAQTTVEKSPYLNPDAPVDKRAGDLVSQLTVKEKIEQLGYRTPSVSRLKLRGFLYWNEALHGIARDRGKATVFP